jgi:hypothetical protein
MQESNSRIRPNCLLSLSDLKTSRRRWLATTFAGASLAAHTPLLCLAVDARSNVDDPTMSKITRVKSVLEVKGAVKLKNHRGKPGDDHRSAPIEAKSTLEYEEAYRIGIDAQSRIDDFAYQYYRVAELDNLIEKHPTKLSLRESCRELVRTSISGEMSSVCIDHPLTASEQDLVESPVATMYLEQLLPARATKIGDSWELSAEMAAKLFNLDVVNSGSVKVTLIDADEKLGQLALKGQLEGEVRSVETKIFLDGTAKIDRKEGLVSWVAITFDEERAVGESEPGFKIQARLRILRERTKAVSTGNSLADMVARLEKATTVELVQFDSKLGAYTFVADRNWTTYSDSGVDATLRWVKKNRLVAQCTITNMTDMEPGRQLSIEGYQNDIQKALGKRFGQFLEADERLSQTGLRMMRIVTIGQVEGVPVQWIHILLSNDAGRHLALAYSMNASSVETFGTNDLQMAGSFEFTLRQLPVAPEESKSDDTKALEATKSAAKPTEKIGR